MSMLDYLEDHGRWEHFYNYKVQQGNTSERDLQELCSFIESREYLPVVRRIKHGESFAPPVKKLVNKSGAGRKRAVYTFSREENYVLKLTAFLLRDYDSIFAPNLYSFRKDRGVKAAIREVLKIKGLSGLYTYKADISDYFNSVNAELLLPELRRVLAEDEPMYRFLSGLLLCPYACFEGKIVKEQKGIMAGVPISGFLANLYLRSMDFFFHKQNIPYLRYSDDIIVFAKTREELCEYTEHIGKILSERGLKINREKEIITAPGESWSFLGFSYGKGIIDVCPVSLEKLKAKMRRKTRALSRWASRKGVSRERAARTFVRRLNTKLYDNPVYNELTWARWFFPVINTDAALKKIDAYAQECVRYLATGRRTKSKYNFRYEDIKALGYRSLVNEYYKFRENGSEDEESAL